MKALKVPIVIISLIDGDEQWIVSARGLPDTIKPRTMLPSNGTLCRQVVVEKRALIIEDVRDYPQYQDTSLVQQINLAAYAGVPLYTSDGHTVGVLCVIDVKPRPWSESDIAILEDLSHSVMTETDLSLQLIEYEEVKAELAQERDLLRALIDSFPDYIFVKDDEGRFVISNKAHAEAAQIADPEELVGKTAFDTFPPELAEQYDEDDRAVIASAEPLFNLERQTVDPSGQLRWVLTTKVPFTSRDRKMRGLVGISRDITDRKRAEQALRDRERFIEQILMTSPTFVYVYDLPSAKIVYSNAEIAVILGYDSEELHQFGPRLFAKLMHSDDHIRLQELYRHLDNLKDGDVIEDEFRLLHHNGQYRWLYSRSAVFMRDNHGRPIQVIGTALDITERLQAEAALRESEQRLRAIINHAPVILFELDGKGTFVLSEGRGLRSLGIEPLVVNGSNALEVLAHHPTITQRIGRALDGETVDFIFDDGNVVFRMNFTPVKQDSEVTGVIGVATDVTEQIRARDAAAESSARLKLLRDIDAQLTATLDLSTVLQAAIQAAVSVTNADDGYIALLNDGTLTITESVGHYSVGTKLDSASNPLSDILKRQVPVQIEYEKKQSAQKAGVLPTTQSQMVVPITYGDNLIGVLNLESQDKHGFDVDAFTVIKSLAVRAAAAVENARLYALSQTQLVTLQELYDKVRGLEQIKTDMIRIAAHDLRNPLSAAMGYAEMISRGPEGSLSNDQEEYVAMLNNSLRAIQKIITDILSLQRIEALQERANYERVDLSQLAQSVFTSNQITAQAKELNFKIELPSQPVIVCGDSTQLREALDNLIHNAIKYTPEKGSVRVTLATAGNQLTLDVTDTGYGIPEQLQERLFQPFFRAKTAQTRNIDGTGLGLHLVKNIIDRHSGKMHFRSKLGEGSTFGFEMPLIVTEPKNGKPTESTTPCS
ncbi:MAG: PAS domain S-box protein [Anaerolineae bacterium]|nr:PAS domain S-box protein [Anaerolineae bacterium]